MVDANHRRRPKLCAADNTRLPRQRQSKKLACNCIRKLANYRLAIAMPKEIETMAYIATAPASYQGQVVGSGQCVAYVQQASGAPLTANWSQGDLVRGNPTIQPGTAIATFGPDGTYTNSTDGSSHAAIYMSQDDAGLQVWDQWTGQPVHQRTIRFQGGAPGVHPVNDGDAFYVID